MNLWYRKFEYSYATNINKYDHSSCRICDFAFSGCTSFSGDLHLFNVSYIGKNAFYQCGFSGSLIIPLTFIDDYAFYGCSKFRGTLTFNESVRNISNNYVSSEGFYIGAYAFCGCSGFIGELNFPSAYSYIGEYAFCGCSGFNKLEFGNYYYDINEFINDEKK